MCLQGGNCSYRVRNQLLLRLLFLQPQPMVKDGKVPEDRIRSWMVNVYIGKGDALTCGSYRGIKLLEHAMKVWERVTEGRVRKIVKIYNMQFAFMAGWNMTDAIFNQSAVGEIPGKEEQPMDGIC